MDRFGIIICILGLICGTGMAGCAIFSERIPACRLAALWLGAWGSLLVALATSLSLGIGGADRLLLLLPSGAAFFFAAAVSRREEDGYPVYASAAVAFLFLLQICFTMHAYGENWVGSFYCPLEEGCIEYAFAEFLIPLVAVAALARIYARSAAVRSGKDEASEGRSRLIFCLIVNAGLTVPAALCFFSQSSAGDAIGPIRVGLAPIVALTLALLFEHRESAGLPLRAAAVVSLAAPAVLLTFTGVPALCCPFFAIFLGAVVCAALFVSEGRPLPAICCIAACLAVGTLAAALNGGRLATWAAGDPYGIEWAPAQVRDAASILLPGLQVAPESSCQPYWLYSLTGFLNAYGLLGLVAVAAALASLTVGLVRLARFQGGALPLATAVFLLTSVLVSVLDQFGAPLYTCPLPFVSCGLYPAMALIFLVCLCVFDCRAFERRLVTQGADVLASDAGANLVGIPATDGCGNCPVSVGEEADRPAAKQDADGPASNAKEEE